jgi:hypothetical protein
LSARGDHQRFDDFNIIIEEIQGNSPLNPSDTERVREQIEPCTTSALLITKSAASSLAIWPRLLVIAAQGIRR